MFAERITLNPPPNILLQLSSLAATVSFGLVDLSQYEMYSRVAMVSIDFYRLQGTFFSVRQSMQLQIRRGIVVIRERIIRGVDLQRMTAET
jgi:hypothetical protein